MPQDRQDKQQNPRSPILWMARNEPARLYLIIRQAIFIVLGLVGAAIKPEILEDVLALLALILLGDVGTTEAMRKHVTTSATISKGAELIRDYSSVAGFIREIAARIAPADRIMEAMAVLEPVAKAYRKQTLTDGTMAALEDEVIATLTKAGIIK